MVHSSSTVRSMMNLVVSGKQRTKNHVYKRALQKETFGTAVGCWLYSTSSNNRGKVKGSNCTIIRVLPP